MPLSAPAAAPSACVPAKGERISVFWSGDRHYYDGCVLAVHTDGTARVLYDPDYARQPRHERTFVHDMHSERWRYAS